MALGTVADVVALDNNNRILVHQGLLAYPCGQMSAGIKGAVRGGWAESVTACQRFRLFLGPRLNAVGRLDDMTMGYRLSAFNDETLLVIGILKWIL